MIIHECRKLLSIFVGKNRVWPDYQSIVEAVGFIDMTSGFEFSILSYQPLTTTKNTPKVQNYDLLREFNLISVFFEGLKVPF
jgi:hypothetical protein